MTPVLIGLGSNQGDRHQFLQRAAVELSAMGIQELRCSPIYETEPVDIPLPQPDFLNAVVYGYTTCSLLELFERLKAAEQRLGRRYYGGRREREIDLDLLLFGYHQYTSPELWVPHPRMHCRRFVLQPATDIVPFLTHPVFGLSLCALLRRCSDTARVQRWTGPSL